MLIIGQSDKMLTDLRNSKGSTKPSAVSMWIVVSGDNHNLSNLVSSLCMSQCLGKVRDTVRSMLHCIHSSHFLLRQPYPEALSYRCLIQPSVSTFTNIVLCHRWLCSNILKPTLHFFLQSARFIWYMHHHSLAQAQSLFYGEI
jgi:hypothetical protein